MIICPHCGEPNSNSVCFCAKCKLNVYWNPQKSAIAHEDEKHPVDEKFRYCGTLLICAVVLGVIAAVFSTMHVGNTIWGSSPYNEAESMWTIDNSGRSRFRDYQGYIIELTVGFIFMLISIPVAGVLAAFRQRIRYLEMTRLCAIVCFTVFIAGYIRWRNLSQDFGFPKYYPSFEDVRTGYQVLVSALFRTAITSGVITIAIGFGMRFVHFMKTKELGKTV
jgi:hypothetical protein